MNPMRRMGASAAVLALTMAACVPSEPAPTEPAAVVADRLVELSEAADAFSGVTVGRGVMSARATQGSKLMHWELTDDVTAVTETATLAPAVSFDQLDEAAVQDQVQALASQCEASEYRISVEVLTSVAMLAELRCGEDTFQGLITSDPVMVLLNGTALPSAMDGSAEGDWQMVLDLLGELDPGLEIGRLSVDPDVVSFRLADGAATEGCRPALVFERDGTDVTTACWRTGTEPAISLQDFAATDLARLQQEAMDEAGIVGPEGVTVTIGRNHRLEPEMQVRRGPDEATLPLTNP